MPVTTLHPQFEKNFPVWETVSDCVAGEFAIKDRGDKYLPKPNPDDYSYENEKRYEAYLHRAVFYNVTGRTLTGLTGQVFRKPPEKHFPSILRALIENVDGSGVGIDQQARIAFRETMSVGRAGLLVDFPKMEKISSVGELERGNISPTINFYRAEDIRNWDTVTIGSKTKLSLVVLHETYVDESESDEFRKKYKSQYRVLSLEGGQRYRIDIMRKVKNNDKGIGPVGESYQIIETYYPKPNNKEYFDFIPFQFIGAYNNDWKVDDSPMLDMSVLNISHYRNSADLENSSFFSSIPTLTISSDTSAKILEEANGGAFRVGGPKALFLGSNGNAELIQAKEANLAKSLMEMKQQQMIAIGARLIEEKTVEITATQIMIEVSGQNSILSMVADNVSSAYTNALKFAKMFVNSTDEEIRYELNKDFEFKSMDSQERMQLLAEWQAGAITFEEMRTTLRKDGIAMEDDSIAKAKMAENVNLIAENAEKEQESANKLE